MPGPDGFWCEFCDDHEETYCPIHNVEKDA